MHLKNLIRFLIIISILIVLPPFLFIYFQYFSKAAPVKANFVVDAADVVGPIQTNWKALAQGGEEIGVRMLQNVVPQLTTLAPHYIRLDHIYDFYGVVKRNTNGQLVFSWDKLDETVCDIYATGAQPFFALGYMPPVMSDDGSLIGQPTNWNEWALLVQKTVERYSGLSTVLCNGQVSGARLADIHYEVWNEPDLESFGKWSLYDAKKSYRTLYYYSLLGAERANNVNHFLIGGPATTAAYRNWFQVFLDYVRDNNLRIDFLSWHHYTKNTDDYTQDLTNINDWLADPKYDNYRSLPRMITEWGYDPEPNPLTDTNIGAAHTVSAIKKLIDQNLQYAFAFDIKDGPFPRWGILSHTGQKKPRYYALDLLNRLDANRVRVDGDGTYVQGLATISPRKLTVLLVNYDPANTNTEQVPITFKNLQPGEYKFDITTLRNSVTTTSINVTITDEPLVRSIIMQPGTVIVLEIQRTQ